MSLKENGLDLYALDGLLGVKPGFTYRVRVGREARNLVTHWRQQVIHPIFRKPMVEEVPGILRLDDIEHLMSQEPFLRIAPMPISKKLEKRIRLASKHGSG